MLLCCGCPCVFPPSSNGSSQGAQVFVKKYNETLAQTPGFVCTSETQARKEYYLVWLVNFGVPTFGIYKESNMECDAGQPRQPPPSFDTFVAQGAVSMWQSATNIVEDQISDEQSASPPAKKAKLHNMSVLASAEPVQFGFAALTAERMKSEGLAKALMYVAEHFNVVKPTDTGEILYMDVLQLLQAAFPSAKFERALADTEGWCITRPQDKAMSKKIISKLCVSLVHEACATLTSAHLKSQNITTSKLSECRMNALAIIDPESNDQHYIDELKLATTNAGHLLSYCGVQLWFSAKTDAHAEMMTVIVKHLREEINIINNVRQQFFGLNAVEVCTALVMLIALYPVLELNSKFQFPPDLLKPGDFLGEAQELTAKQLLGAMRTQFKGLNAVCETLFA